MLTVMKHYELRTQLNGLSKGFQVIGEESIHKVRVNAIMQLVHDFAHEQSNADRLALGCDLSEDGPEAKLRKALTDLVATKMGYDAWMASESTG